VIAYIAPASGREAFILQTKDLWHSSLDLP